MSLAGKFELPRGRLHQVESAGALDLTGNLAMELGGNSGRAPGIDLAGLSREFAEKFRIEIADLIGLDVVATAWHAAVRAAHVDRSLFGFRTHNVFRVSVTIGLPD